MIPKKFQDPNVEREWKINRMNELCERIVRLKGTDNHGYCSFSIPVNKTEFCFNRDRESLLIMISFARNTIRGGDATEIWEFINKPSKFDKVLEGMEDYLEILKKDAEDARNVRKEKREKERRKLLMNM
jgi:hypothetical protein